MAGKVFQVKGHHAQDERVQAQPKDRHVDQEQRIECRQHAHGQVCVEEKADGASQEQAPAQRAAECHPRGNSQQGQGYKQGDDIVPLLLRRTAYCVVAVQTATIDHHVFAAMRGERIRLTGGLVKETHASGK